MELIYLKNMQKKALKSKLQPIVNKHLKNYQIFFFPGGEVIFKIVKKHKGHLFSFDYGSITYKEKGRPKKQIKIKSNHYHINYKSMHKYIAGIKLIGKGTNSIIKVIIDGFGYNKLK